MLLEKIDVEKSIAHQKIFRKSSLINRTLDLLYNLFFILSFPFLAFFNLINTLKTENSFYAIMFFIVTFLISLLFFYAFVNINKLRKIEGLSQKENKQLILQIVEELEWKIYRDNIQFTHATSDWNCLSFDYGKEIIVIYENGNILVNCITYGRFDTKLFFYWFVNRKKENEIIEEFENQIQLRIEKKFSN
ncbi:hypothetical protein M0M57_10355 [Flavobacterium azooxidireducens]|uniref:YcxB-like protein domain-containing protein n=1 Tax=Flavobacterium azooxidireducens TaxID=1871076 RepID=A0ABY4KB58_9FLAO|nr:hypothetical protein [Flavobacterium azooxidireducens]UPQ78035.1 hypothetical protein M0M57_10355 [Flavobacterium azooxidireducens]